MNRLEFLKALGVCAVTPLAPLLPKKKLPERQEFHTGQRLTAADLNREFSRLEAMIREVR